MAQNKEILSIFDPLRLALDFKSRCRIRKFNIVYALTHVV